jgi:poly-beta-hydroxyalkanoate depolymerase
MEHADSDQALLRRISLGLRHDRGILPADDRRRVPAPPAAQGRDEASRPRVDPGAITDVAILAIEGERDDISGIGQTKAALKIATSLPAESRNITWAKSVGHYGIFNGRRWREQIAPVLEGWIADHEAKA